MISSELGDNDPGVSLNEFIAFHFFTDKIDTLKQQILLYRYLDYHMYLELMSNISQADKQIVKEGLMMSEHQAKFFFMLIDTDDSGELEPDELLFFGRSLFA